MVLSCSLTQDFHLHDSPPSLRSSSGGRQDGKRTDRTHDTSLHFPCLLTKQHARHLVDPKGLFSTVSKHAFLSAVAQHIRRKTRRTEFLITTIWISTAGRECQRAIAKSRTFIRPPTTSEPVTRSKLVVKAHVFRKFVSDAQVSRFQKCETQHRPLGVTVNKEPEKSIPILKEIPTWMHEIQMFISTSQARYDVAAAIITKQGTLTKKDRPRQ